MGLHAENLRLLLQIGASHCALSIEGNNSSRQKKLRCTEQNSVICTLMSFRSGFVSIIGLPNAGKSTLYNKLVGEKLSVVNPKAQTTRHRILGIVNREQAQIIYSDTPGLVRRVSNKMHEHMVGAVMESLDDADVLVYLANPKEHNLPEAIADRLSRSKASLVIALNKIDLATQEQIEAEVEGWRKLNPTAVIPLSALHGFNIISLEQLIISLLPEHPAYFPEDQLTDRTDRFFVNEIIRGKILTYYSQEIPYSIEVITQSFKDNKNLLKIQAEVICERESQKAILIGQNGRALKRTATAARQDLEAFFGKQVFLEVRVKVREDWRDKDSSMREFGYQND
jgi:GTP-binding protein Era